jgi:serine/threonine protein kinase
MQSLFTLTGELSSALSAADKCLESGRILSVLRIAHRSRFLPSFEDRLEISAPSGQIGQIFDGRFQILALIGAGATSFVYEANQLDFQRLVAIKILRMEKLSSEREIERFRREAVATAALQHPNITQIYGFGVSNGRPYIAMELMHGRSLAGLLSERTRLNVQEAMPLFEQILDGIAHAHQTGIIHRDLKPSNIMLVHGDTQVKIVDFGLSTFLSESGRDMQKLTKTDSVLGTVLYMSPEQCMGKKADARSDLYSLGCVFYEMLTGKPPFMADTAFATINQHVTDPAPDHELVNNPIGAVILACLEKDPASRPASAAALREALREPEKFKFQRKDRSSTTRKHNPRLIKPLACAVLFALCVLALWIYLDQQPKPKANDAEIEPRRDRLRIAKDQAETAIKQHMPAAQLKDAQRNLRQALAENANDRTPRQVPIRIDATDDLLRGDFDLNEWDALIDDRRFHVQLFEQPETTAAGTAMWLDQRDFEMTVVEVQAYCHRKRFEEAVKDFQQYIERAKSRQTELNIPEAETFIRAYKKQNKTKSR